MIVLKGRKFSYCSHSVVHNSYCCSVVTVNNKNSVQRPTFTYLVQKQPAPDRAAHAAHDAQGNPRPCHGPHSTGRSVCPVCPLLVCPGLHQYLFSKQGDPPGVFLYQVCPVCVAVSRLPPVSFYRKIAKHGGATSVSQSPLVCHHGGEPLSFAWVV